MQCILYGDFFTCLLNIVPIIGFKSLLYRRLKHNVSIFVGDSFLIILDEHVNFAPIFNKTVFTAISYTQ